MNQLKTDLNNKNQQLNMCMSKSVDGKFVFEIYR